MASLFEQYEQAAQKSADLTAIGCQPLAERSISRILPLAAQDTEPIFSKRRINFKTPSPIVDMTVRNNQLALAMANKCVGRLDIGKPEQAMDETDLTRHLGEQSPQSKIRRIFLDVTGNHLLVSVVAREGEAPVDVFYLNRKARKPKSAAKMKAHVINAVAWNHQLGTEASTGAILVGTNKGLIFETSLSSAEDRSLTLSSSSPEQYWKQLFHLGKVEPTSVTGLEYHVLPGNKCFVIVTTPTRLYQFLGTVPSLADHPVMVHVFNNYPDIPVRYQDIPSNLPYSELQFFYPKPWELPKSVAWMTGSGVLCYGMDYSGKAGVDSVTTERKHVNYPKGKDAEGVPMAIALTEFHVLVLYRDRVKGFSILSDQLVMDDIFTETYGSMVQLTKDPVTGTIWACSEYAVYRYNVVREARHVWQVFLGNGDYESAKEYCRDDAANLDVVLTRQADDLFGRKLYEDSATVYAKTHVSFEEVALKFLQAEQKNGLKTYLLQKLAGLRPQDMTQTTMIVTWLVELYLNHLGELSDGSQRGTPAYAKLNQEFHGFLALPSVKECARNNCATIYDLMSSHGNQEALIGFAVIMQDFERVVQFHLHNGNYREALAVLQKQKRVDLFYQFCPLLMQFVPTETVDACIAFARKLDPSRLIPALVHYNHNRGKLQERNEAIRYLDFCVRRLDNKERTIHNYLLSLYAKTAPDKLETYLNAQGQDPATVSYDLEYALRVCSECGLRSACVHIYAVMGLYEEAVDLALQFDVDKAKQYADRPEENEDLRKKLWLKIAHHVVKEENDIGRAMEFLQQCDLIKIEDILPFFPSFVTIDHFKDAICQSLLEYNQHIEGLKDEMEEATQSTKEIRAETRSFRNKYTLVSSQNKCVSCCYPVLTCSFYAFPCRHMFHVECLVAEVLPQLGTAKKQRVEEIQRHLASSGREESGALTAASSREDMKAELDAVLATECPYCGELMIRSVDLPFISSSDFDKIMQGWE